MSTTNCTRCGRLCMIAGPGNPEARLMKLSDGPGFCPDCCMTAWLQTTPGISDLIADVGPDKLLTPAVQAQIARLMQSGNADADPSELDWKQIVANWNLPFETPRKRARRKP